MTAGGNSPTTPDADRKSYEMGEFRPEDAAGIVQLFRSVYGEGYPIRVFYDEHSLIDANEKGEYCSIVARSASGEIVGVEHLYRSAPFPGLYEAGAGLVRKDYRGIGVNRQLLGYVYGTWIPERPSIEEVFGEPVCNHPIMQKEVIAFDHIETALEVALMPAEAYDKERSAKGRVAALMAFRCYKPKPHIVYLPQVYEESCRFAYGKLDDTRNFDLSREDMPRDSKTVANMRIFDFAKVARIAVHEAGDDFADVLASLEREARSQGVQVFQVWLKLSQPWVGSATEMLRTSGYFFGGVLPRWFDDDGMLMQKVLCDPCFDGIVLHSDWSKEFLGLVRADYERAAAGLNVSPPSGHRD